MKILIDADGCPVIDIAIKIANKNEIECVLICDTSHIFDKLGAKTVMVSKGNDSVDFKLVNMVEAGDIVITQDYGLAAMCLAKKAKPISQNGLIYTPENIDGLLMARHTSKLIRKAGGRIKGNKKRTHEQDIEFEMNMSKLLI